MSSKAHAGGKPRGSNPKSIARRASTPRRTAVPHMPCPPACHMATSFFCMCTTSVYNPTWHPKWHSKSANPARKCHYATGGIQLFVLRIQQTAFARCNCTICTKGTIRHRCDTLCDTPVYKTCVFCMDLHLVLQVPFARRCVTCASVGYLVSAVWTLFGDNWGGYAGVLSP